MYIGMELVFKQGNDNVDLGWASNNSCTLVDFVLDDREPPDDGSGDAWELQYRPLGLIVRPVGIPPEEIGVVSEDLPEGTFLVETRFETNLFEIPASLLRNHGVPPQAPSKIKVRREGFKLIPAVAATDFFAQGQTFRGHPVVIDLRIPPKGAVSMSGFYVMLSRATTLDDVYLLHPLWPPGDETARSAYIQQAKIRFRFGPDVRAEETNLRRKHDVTIERIKADISAGKLPQPHYVDSSVDPNRCATCGAQV